MIRSRVQDVSADGEPLWTFDWLPNISQKRELYLQLVDGELALEHARFWLPQATLTRLYATASYRNWFSWLLSPNDSHAQREAVYARGSHACSPQGDQEPRTQRL